ncbi:MAG TPA: adenylate/guanylate cyclase domain-containing protein [Chitinophagaceae bacterium]
MERTHLIVPGGSVVNKRALKLIVTIALCWTIIDFLLLLLRMKTGMILTRNNDPYIYTTRALLLREVNVLLFSFMVGFLLVSVLKRFLRNHSLWVNLVVKTLLLVAAAIVMSFCIYVSYEVLIRQRGLAFAIDRFSENKFRPAWLFPKMVEWIILFLLTQLALEINGKYSGGVFFDIMTGKYLQPKEEKRILLFVDLKNSTPIAEKLGHKEYFSFIRDFIYCMSVGIMEHDGRIYQYVGDEIVAWWPGTEANAKKAVKSLIESRKVLNINTDIFKQKYDIVPEYKAGMHAGNIMVGQVGIAKKELVMSGDTINTASRIRTACTDLNQKFLVSKEMIDLLTLKDWQSESMGIVDMKGKNQEMELFALKI